MAKDQKPPEPAPEVEAVTEVVGPPKSYRLQIALGFVSLILLEMIMLWFLLPSKPASQPNVGLDAVAGVGGYENSNLVPPSIGETEKTVERPLKEATPFKVKNLRGDTNELFSIVLSIKIREADATKFDKRYAVCTNEVIDRVVTILGATTTEERSEATYTTIKEKVKRGINEVLGTPWVLSVLCADPSLESQ
jgi:hypothetical protein